MNVASFSTAPASHTSLIATQSTLAAAVAGGHASHVALAVTAEMAAAAVAAAAATAYARANNNSSTKSVSGSSSDSDDAVDCASNAATSTVAAMSAPASVETETEAEVKSLVSTVLTVTSASNTALTSIKGGPPVSHSSPSTPSDVDGVYLVTVGKISKTARWDFFKILSRKTRTLALITPLHDVSEPLDGSKAGVSVLAYVRLPGEAAPADNSSTSSTNAKNNSNSGNSNSNSSSTAAAHAASGPGGVKAVTVAGFVTPLRTAVASTSAAGPSKEAGASGKLSIATSARSFDISVLDAPIAYVVPVAGGKATAAVAVTVPRPLLLPATATAPDSAGKVNASGGAVAWVAAINAAAKGASRKA